MHGSGNYKLSFGELYGNLHITVGEKQPVSGSLVSGLSANDVVMKISYIEK